MSAPHQRSAFDVLKQNAASGLQKGKRKAGTQNEAHGAQKRSASKPDQHTYGTCPICQRSIPANFLQMHAATCNGAAATSGPTALRHLPVDVPTNQAPPQQQQADAAQATQQLMPVSRQAPPESPHTHQAPAAPRADAFKVLMNAQKTLVSKTHHTFFLELTGSGWRWHWWAHTAAKPGAGGTQHPDSNSRPTTQAVWTAEITLKEQQQIQQPSAPTGAQPAVPLPSSATAVADVEGHTGTPSITSDEPDGAPDTHYGADGDGEGDDQLSGAQGAHDTGGAPGQPAGAAPTHTQPPPATAPGPAEMGGSEEPGSPGSPGSPGGRQRRGASHTSIIHLQTNVHPGAGGPVDRQQGSLPSNRLPPEGRWQGLPSGIKSALQKAIRRGNGPAAVRIALEMVKTPEGAGELLRRVPIIALEDTLMHPALPLVVWLMAAQSKGYTLGALHVTAVLHMVYSLAAVPVRDYLPPLTMCPGNAIVHSLADADAALPGKPQEAALLKSLLLRASFGGMSGDVSMLRGYATYWARRFQGTAAPPPQLPAAPAQQQGSIPCTSQSQPRDSAHHNNNITQGSHIAVQPSVLQPAVSAPAGQPQQPDKTQWLSFLESAFAAGGPVPPECCVPLRVGPLTRADIPLTAIDFHVSDILVHLLGIKEVHEALEAVTLHCWGSEADSENCLRQTIWLFRSSINHRPFLQLLPLPEPQPQLQGTPQDSSVNATAGTISGDYPRAPPVHILREMEAERLEGDLDRDEAHRARLEPVHAAAQRHADQYAASIINKHFQRPRSQPYWGR